MTPPSTRKPEETLTQFKKRRKIEAEERAKQRKLQPVAAPEVAHQKKLEEPAHPKTKHGIEPPKERKERKVITGTDKDGKEVFDIINEIITDYDQIEKGRKRHFGVYRVKAECQLDVYLMRWNEKARRELKGTELSDKLAANTRLHNAGMKLREADQFSAKNIQTVDLLNLIPGQHGGDSLVFKCVVSKEIVRQANMALSPAQLKVVKRVCCDGDTAGGTYAIETLQRGLKVLADLSAWPCMDKWREYAEKCRRNGEAWRDSKNNVPSRS
jgi:hypothetical protein